MIFLDLRRDRYFLMTDVRRKAFDRLLNGEPNDSGAMTLLVDTGLFVRSELGFRIEAPAVEVAAEDLSRPDCKRSSLRSIYSAWCALAWASRALKPDRLPITIEQLLRAKQPLDCSGQERQLKALGMAFARARTFVPIAPRCLVDSLALYRMALSRSLTPTLVFGVRTNPFAAHCWLQSGAHVLTGTAEEARNYQPILVV
jgi:hypothetical protein